MTSLSIDGIFVSLPPEFSISVTEENPYITKAGEYSYDVELSLLDPTNAKLYKHLNRLDRTVSITGRKAVIVHNAKLLLSGTEVILGWTDTSVKIQLVSGNSELNYLFSEGKKIWENDFGSVTPSTNLTLEAEWETLSQQYPYTNVVYAPFITMAEPESYTHNISSYIRNSWDIFQGNDLHRNGKGYPLPYLLYYIEKFIELKGYTIGTNILRSDVRAMKMYVLNSAQSYNLSEILPDWTEEEFITEVEKFFNINFILNSSTKVIDIVREVSVTTEFNTIENIIEGHEVNIEKESSNINIYGNVAYTLPTTAYFKVQKINDEVWEHINVVELANYGVFAGLPRTYEQWNTINNNRIIYKLLDTGEYYILDRMQFSYESEDMFYYFIRKINIFQSAIVDNNASETSLKITPVKMYLYRYYNDGTSFTVNISYQYPWCAEMKETQENKTRDQIIAEGQNTWRPKFLEVAMYTGLKVFSAKSGSGVTFTVNAPYSHTDNEGELKDIHFGFDTIAEWEAIRSSWFTNEDTLRLYGTFGLFKSWYKKPIYDSTKPYIIYFLQQSVNLKLPTLINNKIYICEKIEYDIDQNGIKEDTMKGTFYPLLEE